MGDHQNRTSDGDGGEEDGIHCGAGENPTGVATGVGMCCQAPYAAQSGRNGSGVDLNDSEPVDEVARRYPLLWVFVGMGRKCRLVVLNLVSSARIDPRSGTFVDFFGGLSCA